jgi:hypothetical protein
MAKLSSLLVDDEFTTVRSEVIRLLGGNANAAVVLSRINFRANKNYRNAIEDGNGAWWWRASTTEIAEETGLTVDQVRFAVKKLVDGGWVTVQKHRKYGSSDHTWSYRIVDREVVDEARHADLVNLPDRSGKSPTSDLGNLPHLQSYKKTEETLSGAGDSFVPSSDDLAWAVEKTPALDVDLETEVFNMNAKSKGYVYERPDMAWRTWMLKSQAFLKRVGEDPGGGTRSSSRQSRNPTAKSIEALRKTGPPTPTTEPPNVNGRIGAKSWAEQWREELTEQMSGEEE